MKALLSLTLACALMPAVSFASSAGSCTNIFSESLAYELPPFANRAELKAEFLAEGSQISKSYLKQMQKVATAVGDAMQLPVQIQGLQQMALNSGGNFNGWKVTQLDSINATKHGLYEYSAFTNALGDKKIVLLESTNDAVLLNVATTGKDVKNVEIIIVKIATQSKNRFTF